MWARNEDRALLEADSRAQADGLRSALAVVIRIEGSSYRRPGAKMLIAEDGVISGAVSGGCLERDLIQRAIRVLATGKSERVIYDTRLDSEDRDDEDSDAAPSVVRKVNTSLGCEGVIEILIDPNPRPWLDTIARVLETRRDAVFVYSLELGTELKSAATGLAALALEVKQSYCLDEVFFDLNRAPPRLILFGAGHDAIPMTRIARELGWWTGVADCRSGFPQAASHFRHVDRYLKCLPEEACRSMGIDAESLVLVMTHHLEHDRAILRELIPIAPRYLGLLGPRTRGARLLAETAVELGIAPESIVGRARFPVGLDLGGEGASAIALAAIAEIHALIHEREAGFLKNRQGPIHPRN